MMTKDEIVNYLLLCGFTQVSGAKNEGEFDYWVYNRFTIPEISNMFIATSRMDVIRYLKGKKVAVSHISYRTPPLPDVWKITFYDKHTNKR